MGDGGWFKIEVPLAEAIESTLSDEEFVAEVHKISDQHGVKLTPEYEDLLLRLHHAHLSKIEHNANSKAHGEGLAQASGDAKGSIGSGFDSMMQPFMQAGQQGMQAMGQLPQQAMQGLQGLGQGGSLKDALNPKNIGDMVKGIVGESTKMNGNDAAGHDASLSENGNNHGQHHHSDQHGHDGHQSSHNSHHSHRHAGGFDWGDDDYDGSPDHTDHSDYGRDSHITLNHPTITINPDATGGGISTQAGGIDASLIADDLTARDAVKNNY